MDFKNSSRSAIKDRIIKDDLIPYECGECSLNEWNGKDISLHLDHIDGNNKNNLLSNLRFLCPNCHSQTETYCGKNNRLKYGTKNQKITDDNLVNSMQKSKNPAEALRMVGLAGAGNYKRVYRLADIYNIEHMKKRTPTNFSFVCEGCNKEHFVTSKKESNQKYCSVECRRDNQVKIPIERILEVMNETNWNYSAAGKILGISDNGIRKRIKKNGGGSRI